MEPLSRLAMRWFGAAAASSGRCSMPSSSATSSAASLLSDLAAATAWRLQSSGCEQPPVTESRRTRKDTETIKGFVSLRELRVFVIKATTRATSMNIKTVGVIGAGTMGHGIAQVFAQAGFSVRLVDVGEPMLDRARAAI